MDREEEPRDFLQQYDEAIEDMKLEVEELAEQARVQRERLEEDQVREMAQQEAEREEEARVEALRTEQPARLYANYQPAYGRLTQEEQAREEEMVQRETELEGGLHIPTGYFADAVRATEPVEREFLPAPEDTEIDELRETVDELREALERARTVRTNAQQEEDEMAQRLAEGIRNAAVRIEQEQETPEQAERRRGLTRQMIEQINNAPAIAVNPDQPPRVEHFAAGVIRGDIAVNRATVQAEPIQFDPGRITAGNIDTGQLGNVWGNTTQHRYVPPRRYEFDFKKVNSIEDIAKVLETFQKTMHINITQNIMEEMGIKDIVKRTDDINF